MFVLINMYFPLLIMYIHLKNGIDGITFILIYSTTSTLVRIPLPRPVSWIANKISFLIFLSFIYIYFSRTDEYFEVFDWGIYTLVSMLFIKVMKKPYLGLFYNCFYIAVLFTLFVSEIFFTENL